MYRLFLCILASFFISFLVLFNKAEAKETILSYSYHPTIISGGVEEVDTHPSPPLVGFLAKNRYLDVFALKKSGVPDEGNEFFQKNKMNCIELLKQQQTGNDLRDCLAFWLLVSPEDPELPHFFYRETQTNVNEVEDIGNIQRTQSRVWGDDSDNAFVKYVDPTERFDTLAIFGKFVSDLKYYRDPPCIPQSDMDLCFGIHYLSEKEENTPFSGILLGIDAPVGAVDSTEIYKGNAPQEMFYSVSSFLGQKSDILREHDNNKFSTDSPMNVAYYTLIGYERDRDSSVFYTESIDKNLYNQISFLVRQILLKYNNPNIKAQLLNIFTNCKNNSQPASLKLVCRSILLNELSE